MKTVRAALHGHRDLRAAAEAVLGRVCIRLDLEFFQRFYGWHEIGDVNTRVLRIHSIQTDDLVSLALAIGAHGKALPGYRKAGEAVAAARALTELDARHQHREADHVTTIERKLDDALVFNHPSDSGCLGVQDDGR